MFDVVPMLIMTAAQSFATGMGANLVESLPFSASHPFWGPLSAALANTADRDIQPAALLPQLGMVPSNLRDGVAALLSAVFKNVKHSAPISPGMDMTLDAASAFQAFTNLVAVHTELHRLYSATRPDGGYQNAFLNPVVLEVCRELTRVSAVASSLSSLPIRETGSPRGIKDATRQAIEKSLQVSASHMTDSEWAGEVHQNQTVGDIMWSLANILWRHYAQRKLHTQAQELSKTFHAIQPSEEKRIGARGYCIPQTAVAESYYWRGRLGVVLLEIRGARRWLEKAWNLCPEHAWQQRRAIMIRLIPVALLSGLIPHRAVLEQYSLTEEFLPIIHAFRTGNVPMWRKLLAERREWLRARSIWLIWFERGEILVWRNLFRKALSLHYELPDATRNRCPTATFLDVARAAFSGSGELEDGGLELEDIICVLSSLIDHSIVLGNLAYSQRQVVFRPAPDGFGGFPPVKNVTPRRVEAIA